MHPSRRSLSIAFAALPLIGGITAETAPASAPPARTIYVANAGAPSTITAVNSATDRVTKSIPATDGIAVNVAVAPSGRKAYALIVGSDEQGEPGLMIPINTATDTTAKSIKVGVDPSALAFTPNGRSAYVVDGFDAATTPPKAPGTVTPVNLAKGRPGRPIKVGPDPQSIAITPNGHTAYVTDANAVNGDPTMITPIDLSDNRAEKPIGVKATTIAISLNGRTAFALTHSGVVPISTATNLPGKKIPLRGVPAAAALAPDGQTAWVLATPDPGVDTGSKHPTLTAINTATDSLGKVITLATLPKAGRFFVAITPNGARIYVLAQGSGKGASTIVAITAATDVAQGPVKAGVDDTALLVNPDNKVVYVLSPGNDYQGPPISSHPKRTRGTLVPIPTATDKPGQPIKVGFLPSALAIVP